VGPGELDVRLVTAPRDLGEPLGKPRPAVADRSNPKGTGSWRLKDAITFEKPEASGPLKASR